MSTELIGVFSNTVPCHDESLEGDCAAVVGSLAMDESKVIPFQLDVTMDVYDTYLARGCECQSTGSYTGKFLVMGGSYLNDFYGSEKNPTKVFFTAETIDYLLLVSDQREKDYYTKYRLPLVKEVTKIMSYMKMTENGEYMYKNASSEKKMKIFFRKYTQLTKRIQKIELPLDGKPFSDKDATNLHKRIVYTSLLRHYGIL